MEYKEKKTPDLLLKITAIGTIIYFSLLTIINFVPYLPEENVDLLFKFSRFSREIITMLIFGGTAFVITSTVLSLVSIIAIILMLKHKKSGYFIFIAAQVLLMFIPFLFLWLIRNLFGPMMILGKLYPNLIFTAILIILFSIHYRKFS